MLTMLAFMSWRGLIQPPEGAPPALSSVRMPTLLAASVNRSTVLSDQPRFDHIGTGVGLLLAFVFLPLTVIIKRAMVTPYKLSFSASTGLRVLLTRHERRRPWLLYLTPGLVAAEVLIAVCPFLLFTFMDSRIAPRDGLVRAIVFVAVMALSTAWVVPLKVVVNKVSVQGNLLSAAGEGEQELLLSEHHEDVDEDAAGVDRASSTDEDVLTIRPPLPKYRSLPDALRTIVDEEGWTALYRGWIWTFLSLVFGALGGIPTYRPHV